MSKKKNVIKGTEKMVEFFAESKAKRESHNNTKCCHNSDNLERIGAGYYICRVCGMDTLDR